MKEYEPAKFWDERARTAGHTGWANEVVYRYDQPLRLRAVLSCLRRLHPVLDGVRILDVGCGTGDFVIELARRGATVVGIDISPTVVATAQARCADLPRVTLKATGINEFSAPPNSFDLVTSITVLQHLTDSSQLAQVVQRLCAVLRPGGHLLLLELAPDRGQHVEQALHVRVRTRSEWIDLLREGGFVLVAERAFPQLGILLLHAIRRLVRSRAAPSGSQSDSQRRRANRNRLPSRFVLGTSYLFDHLLAMPIPRRLALYRIFVFRQATAPVAMAE